MLEAKPIANPAVVVREGRDDWTVLYNPDTADAVGINSVGIVVWRLLDGRRSLETIVERVKCKFADAPETVHDDVIALVDDLAERGFVGHEMEGIGEGGALPQYVESGESAAPGEQSLREKMRLATPETACPTPASDATGSALFFAHRGVSMSPTLNELDLLEIVPYGTKPVRVGDVIAIALPDRKYLVAHRVIRVTAKGVCTRGDNSFCDDSWLLQPEQIIGRVVAAWRGRRRRRVFGGAAGWLWARLGRGWRVLGRAGSVCLRRPYRFLARQGVVRRLLPRHWLPRQPVSRALRPRVVVFGSGECCRVRLLLGRRVVGWYVPAYRQWRIRWPFHLLVDEAALPGGRGRAGQCG